MNSKDLVLKGEIFIIISSEEWVLLGFLHEVTSATHLLLIQRKGFSDGQPLSPAHPDISKAQNPLGH